MSPVPHTQVVYSPANSVGKSLSNLRSNDALIAAQQARIALLAQNLEEIQKSRAWRVRCALRDWAQKIGLVDATKGFNPVQPAALPPLPTAALGAPRYVLPVVQAVPENNELALRQAAARIAFSNNTINPNGFQTSAGVNASPSSAAPTASIIIPIYNNLPYTLACLAAITAHPPQASYEVIVVDDASTDVTSQILPTIQGLRYVRQAKNAGFIATCNAGAALARGEYLHFLNNDTQVQPGWLDALLATFKNHANCGFVGARLVYPNGQLQEAGACLNADGSATFIGHLDDPYSDAYQTAYEVDYCSGAAIMLPRALFNQLGGFDAAYAPAYSEDADLAFKVRQAGYGVWLQAAATVLHYESLSDGAGAHGDKYVLAKRNQAIFMARWGTQLAERR